MTTAEQLIQEGLKQGLEKGRQQGLQKGLKQGLEKGRQEGQLEARKATLQTQLTLKFGGISDGAAARIQQASIQELDRWTERILFANEEAEVCGQ